MRIHIRGKFHQDCFCGSKVINFQIVLWWWSSHSVGAFWGFLDPFSPKYGSNLLKFGPEVVHRKTNKVCEQCFKIRCLSTNGTYPKFSFLDHFWAQFTPGKWWILPKNKFFPETKSLGLSDDTSPKSQINQRILTKLSKKPHFWGAKFTFWGTKWAQNHRSRGQTTAYNHIFRSPKLRANPLWNNFRYSSPKSWLMQVLVEFLF